MNTGWIRLKSIEPPATSRTSAILDAELGGGAAELGAVDPDLKPSPLDGKLVLPGDDYPLEYDENGYPEIPECLNRRSTQ